MPSRKKNKGKNSRQAGAASAAAVDAAPAPRPPPPAAVATAAPPLPAGSLPCDAIARLDNLTGGGARYNGMKVRVQSALNAETMRQEVFLLALEKTVACKPTNLVELFEAGDRVIVQNSQSNINGHAGTIAFAIDGAYSVRFDQGFDCSLPGTKLRALRDAEGAKCRDNALADQMKRLMSEQLGSSSPSAPRAKLHLGRVVLGDDCEHGYPRANPSEDDDGCVRWMKAFEASMKDFIVNDRRPAEPGTGMKNMEGVCPFGIFVGWLQKAGKVMPSWRDRAISSIAALGTDWYLRALSDGPNPYLQMCCIAVASVIYLENNVDAGVVADGKLSQYHYGHLQPMLRDIVGDAPREMSRFLGRRVPCSCLKGYSSELKKDSKKGICISCNAVKPIKELMVCTRCKAAQYCSKQCQVEDWPEHKRVYCFRADGIEAHAPSKKK